MLRRATIIAAHVAVAITFSFVLGGGVAVLMLFAALWLVWSVFSLLGDWADGQRRSLIRGRPRSPGG